jgi:hypothetical protein
LEPAADLIDESSRAGQAQAQAATGLATAEKWVEEMFAVARVNSLATIAYRPLQLPMNETARHSNRAALRGRLQRVARQDVDQVSKRIRVDPDASTVLVQLND